MIILWGLIQVLTIIIHQYIYDEQVTILPHPLKGDYLNPSLVCFNNKECLVGIAAENTMKESPTNTLIYPKKLIGRFFDDPEIQEEIKY